MKWQERQTCWEKCQGGGEIDGGPVEKKVGKDQREMEGEATRGQRGDTFHCLLTTRGPPEAEDKDKTQVIQPFFQNCHMLTRAG